jgi:metallo-beta-lactamase class B
VDQIVEDGDTIELGGVSVDCVHIPGHTMGAHCYFFSLPYAGESVRIGIHGGPGLNTLSDDYLARYGLSAERRELYIRSVEKVRSQPVDVFLGIHPGQSKTIAKSRQKTDDHNPFVDAGAWGEFLGDLDTSLRERSDSQNA